MCSFAFIHKYSISFAHTYSGKALDLRVTLKYFDTEGWDYINMETEALPVNGESVLSEFGKANIGTSQEFM